MIDVHFSVKYRERSEYFEWLGNYIGIHDTVECIDGEEIDEGWEGDELVIFKDSVGNVISMYNKDKELECMISDKNI